MPAANGQTAGRALHVLGPAQGAEEWGAWFLQYSVKLGLSLCWWSIRSLPFQSPGLASFRLEWRIQSGASFCDGPLSTMIRLRTCEWPLLLFSGGSVQHPLMSSSGHGALRASLVDFAEHHA